MAYFAVISAMHTINRLLNSPLISIVYYSFKIIKYAYNELESLKQVLERLDDCRISSSRRKKLKELDEEIREAVFNLEDYLESHLSYFLLHDHLEESFGNGNYSDALFSIDEEQINSLVDDMKKQIEKYSDELVNPWPQLEEDNHQLIASSSIDFGRNNRSRIVGLSDAELTELKLNLTKIESYEFQIVSIVGDGRTTRTFLAWQIFEQASNPPFFHVRAMVTIGPNYELKDILIDILSQIDQCVLSWEDEEELGEYLYRCLKGRRYLIVLNDFCDTEIWNLLSSSFPMEDNHGSRVFITTGSIEVAQFSWSCSIHEPTIIIEEEAWDFMQSAEPYPYPPHRSEKISQIQFFLSQRKAEEIELFKKQESKTLKASKFQKLTGLLTCCYTKEKRTELQGGDVLSRTYYAETIAQIFKLFDYVDDIMFVDAHRNLFYQHLNIVGLFGMAGIGKTTLAREIFQDPSVMHYFDLRVWVTLGPNYQSENILADVLAQIDPDIDQMNMMKGDEMLATHFWTKASCKRCLIVLDDVWSEDPLIYLRKLYENFKFEVLLTTRLQQIAGLGTSDDRIYKMRLLNKEESSRFLCECVFGKEIFPHKLEKAGKTIAENCEGLPLMLVTIASILSESEKTPEYWTEVAEEKNLVFEQAYDKISEMLYPSYDHLPQFLKASFLYMAVFPRRYEITSSRLFKLWSFEGIVEAEEWKFDHVAMKHVMELISRSLVLERKTSSNFDIKTCRLHSVYWHFCMREARKTKFFHVLNKISDAYEEHMKGHSRLCIQNNTLLGLKDVYMSMASVTSARSLLCTGPPHQYQVPMCYDFPVLRILDTATIRFYEFPNEVQNLVLLQYYGLTYDGRLPSIISKLRNLECLIVHQHHHTKRRGGPLYLPNEIWDMQALRHLQIMGSDLPDPCGDVLPNLEFLLDVSTHSCTENVFRGIPYLRKLGVQIELMPNAPKNMFSFDDLYHLHYLESLKCVVMNPELIRSRIAASPPPISRLPPNLRKLSLSGFGYAWKNMKTVAHLPHLNVLKLRCYAFQGPEWVVYKDEFKALRYLLLEDTDLKYLVTPDDGLCNIRSLIFRHCYRLEEFPWRFYDSKCKIELFDCSTSASNFVRDNADNFIANVHSSWV